MGDAFLKCFGGVGSRRDILKVNNFSSFRDQINKAKCMSESWIIFSPFFNESLNLCEIVWKKEVSEEKKRLRVV